MSSKKAMNKKQAAGRYIFAFAIIIAGIIFNYLKLGYDFLGFESIGTWLIFVGFIMLAVISIQLISNKKRIVDERMEKIAHKAARITFVFIILGAFVVMVIDAINPITIRYSMFMAHMMAWIVLVYFVTYKILSRYN